MSLEWLLPLLSAIGACVAFFLSKPERPWLTMIAVVLVVLAGAWGASQTFSDLKSKHEVRSAIDRRLIRETDSLLDFISEMIFRASDGWLPRHEEDFFSPRTAQLLCRELDVSRAAPVVAEQPWRNLIYERFSGYQTVLREVLNQHALVLDAELIRTIDKVAGSWLLATGRWAAVTHRTDVSMGFHRPPLLCWGLEPLVEESLRHLNMLYQLLEAREMDAGFSPNRQWLVFPLPAHKHLLGESRFSHSDLSEWRAQYPASPGPAKFGRGDPNKGVLPYEPE